MQIELLPLVNVAVGAGVTVIFAMPDPGPSQVLLAVTLTKLTVPLAANGKVRVYGLEVAFTGVWFTPSIA